MLVLISSSLCTHPNPENEAALQIQNILVQQHEQESALLAEVRVLMYVSHPAFILSVASSVVGPIAYIGSGAPSDMWILWMPLVFFCRPLFYPIVIPHLKQEFEPMAFIIIMEA